MNIVIQDPATGPGFIWARLPGVGERLEGLCRGELYSLIRSGQIRSKTLCKPGKERGIRLIDVASVRRYIERSGRESSACATAPLRTES